MATASPAPVLKDLGNLLTTAETVDAATVTVTSPVTGNEFVVDPNPDLNADAGFDAFTVAGVNDAGHYVFGNLGFSSRTKVQM